MTYGRAFIAGTLALVGALLPAAVGAQISTDGSLRPGTAGPLTGPNFVIGSGVGRTVGNNLFHSFGQFNVGAGESATFTGPDSIGNVISRVTGGQMSSINGLIDSRTFMPSANFFLLNPAGVLLGSGASLNVGGAFHLSTADYLCLGAVGCLADPAAGKFFASLGRENVLTVAAPAAFGFLGPPTGSIVVEGANLPGIADPPVGQTISLVGGSIQITGGSILAPPGGRVQIVSVNSAGEVPISSLDVRGFSSLGSVTVSGSNIDVSGDPGGSVVIRGGNLLIDNGTAITAGTGTLDGAPVGIELSAAGPLSITNGSALISLTFGDGRSGDIRLSGTNVELTNGAAVLSLRAGLGGGGDISLTGDAVTVTGGSAVLSLNQFDGAARNGNISATATGAMLVSEGGSLQSIAEAGDGSQVSVTAGSLTLETGATISSTAFSGRGGDVVVTAPLLTVRSGAQISSTVTGPGRGGDVRVISTGTATLEDAFTGISTGSFFSDPAAPGDGLPGDISGHFGSLTLTGGATIQSGVLAGSQGGNVSLVATGPIVISNGAGIASESFFNDVGNITISAPQVILNNGFISTSTLQSGRAGDISITAGNLTLENGGQIASASIALATGRGGDVHLNVGGSLSISGRSPATELCPTGCSVLPAPFSDFFTNPQSGIYSTTAGIAPGGNITIRSPQIQLFDGGTISASSTGVILASGPAGHINVTASDSITITGASPSGELVLPVPSGIFTTTAGTGPGGDITLSAPQIRLTDGGTISASSTSLLPASEPAGDINVAASGSITITGASPTGASGLFSTTAGTAPGGSITLAAPQIQLADGGTISASSTGVILASGPAGHINVTASDSITVTGASPTGAAGLPGPSGVFTTTAGTGPGGDITLSAPQIRLADGGTISASSTSLLAASAPAGDINVAASGSITITGASPTGASGLFSTTAGTAPGGSITLAAPQIQLADGGTISASSTGVILASGPAGHINVTASDSITVTGASPTGKSGLPGPSGVFTTTANTGPGGNITLSAPQIQLADGGTISASSTGMFPGSGPAGNISVAASGSITITGASPTGASGIFSTTAGTAPGGNITLAAPQIQLADGGTISASSTGVILASGPAGHINVTASDSITVTGASPTGVFTTTAGTGPGGDITLSAPQIRLADGGTISASSTSLLPASEPAGDINVAASGSITITGASPTGASGLFSTTAGTAPGGNITLAAPQIQLADGGTISASSTGVILASGPAGHINVTASDSITVTGASPTGESGLPGPSGVFTTTAGTGPGGDITLSAPQIQLADGGTISASSTSLLPASGPAGDINVAASGSITITGASPTGASGLFSTTAGTAPGGNITLAAPQIQLADGGTISASSTGVILASGPAGHINVTASDSITVTGASPTGVFTTTAGTGPGGDITLSAPQIRLADGGTISASSTSLLPASGPAGDINVAASGSITITGASPTGASGLFSTTAGTAPGGSITLAAPQIQLADGGTISASSTSLLPPSGAAGDIDVTASDSITITGASPTGASGLFSTTAGTGPGGNITLAAPQIRLADGGTISASSTGGPSATAGSINIIFGGLFEMDHASISTDSVQADGGNITITSTGSLLHMIDSQITTSVRSGVGGGGNITLGSSGHPLDFIVLDNSGIHADAFGGPGGNVSIFANVMLSSTPIATAVTASSALSAPGTVNINAVVTDVSGSLAELSTEVLEAAALLRASCAARLAEGKTSSLVVAGREGLPLEPGGLLPSALRELRPAGVAGGAGPFLASEWPGLRRSYLDAACGR